MKIVIALIVGTIATVLLTIPLMQYVADPVVGIMIGAGVWFVMFITVVIAMMSQERARVYTRGVGNQLPDYMVTNNYFNNQAMGRDLNELTQVAKRAELQANFDKMNRGN